MFHKNRICKKSQNKVNTNKLVPSNQRAHKDDCPSVVVTSNLINNKQTMSDTHAYFISAIN